MSDYVVYKKGQQKNTARLDFLGDFEGQYVVTKTNPKVRIVNALGGDSADDRDDALASLILEHNLQDDDGNLLPKKLTRNDIRELGMDQYFPLLEGVNEAIVAAPWFPKPKGETGENSATE